LSNINDLLSIAPRIAVRPFSSKEVVMAGGRRVPWEMKMDESISKAASAMIPFGLPGFPKPSAAASAREGND
jgi:hypothetical protein